MRKSIHKVPNSVNSVSVVKDAARDDSEKGNGPSRDIGLYRYHEIANGTVSQLKQGKGMDSKSATGRWEDAGQSHSEGLPKSLKHGIESLSGVDMSEVRVITNSSAPAQLQAHAFARGKEIHLGPGQEKHLPHEAWHVVQQAQGRVKPTLQAKGWSINDEQHLENEADTMGARAASLGGTLAGMNQGGAMAGNEGFGSANETFQRQQDKAANLPIIQLKLVPEDARDLYQYYVERYEAVIPWLAWQPTHARIVRESSDLESAMGLVDQEMKVIIANKASASSESKSVHAPAKTASVAHSATTAPQAIEDVNEEAEEEYYGNGRGLIIEKSKYERLKALIDAYDVPLDSDFKRGSAMGGDGLNAIGVGLGDLASYIKLKENRDLKWALDNLIHPGAKDHSRNVKYKGRSFMQILAMCAEGKECHNDLAKALHECLDTLKPE